MHANDLFTTITAQLIDDIETGAAGNWRMPWHHLADAGTPTSIDQRPYRGMNAVWLAMIGAAHGWTSGSFGTYRAWQRHGAQVRRGERATQVVLWKPTNPKDPKPGDDSDDTSAGRARLIARAFAVFAAEQCDGAEEIIADRNQRQAERDTPERIDAAEISRELFRAMEELPDSEREALELHAIDDLSPREVGEALGISPVSARVRLHRARRALRQTLGDEESLSTIRSMEA